jgi:hypothetical protein
MKGTARGHRTETNDVNKNRKEMANENKKGRKNKKEELENTKEMELHQREQN